MGLLGNVKHSWLPGGGGHQIARGAVALVSGTAAIGVPFSSIESAVVTPLTGTATPNGTVTYSVGHVASTVNGVVSLSSDRNVIVRSSDEASTNQVYFYITGF